MRIQILACCRNRLYASRNLILYFAVVFVILVWGMTFANTRALLEDFSALEIQFLWFALAWAMLWVWEGGRGLGRRSRGDRPTSAGDGRAEDGGRNARALPAAIRNAYRRVIGKYRPQEDGE